MQKAVILAGGLGNRLKPLTQSIPKPLLPIGEKSVLEIQIQHLAQNGFNEIFIATNYKADYVKSFIGDGKKYGISVKFSKEDIPLGTCGPLSLLRKELNEPFILMNGDILSNIDFQKLYNTGLKNDSLLTVVTKEIRTPFNFGSVQVKDDFIVGVEEKPDLVLEILAGIYFIRPEMLNLIPDSKYYGIDSLIKRMLSEKINISRYLMKEYWLDIGRLDDYEEAQVAYEKHFKK